MEIQISYFYNVRHFKPNMIPLSTAVWDPKWYHNFGSQDIVYIDKNGVYNGLRIKPLVPGKACHDLCRGLDNCKTKDPTSCQFLKNYKAQLDALDFDKIYEKMAKLCDSIKNTQGFSENPIIVIMVHEKPDKPCSERWSIIQWFREHGHEVTEFQRNKGE